MMHVPQSHMGRSEDNFLEVGSLPLCQGDVSFVSAILCYEMQANWSMSIQVILLSPPPSYWHYRGVILPMTSCLKAYCLKCLENWVGNVIQLLEGLLTVHE